MPEFLVSLDLWVGRLHLTPTATVPATDAVEAHARFTQALYDGVLISHHRHERMDA